MLAWAARSGAVTRAVLSATRQQICSALSSKCLHSSLPGSPARVPAPPSSIMSPVESLAFLTGTCTLCASGRHGIAGDSATSDGGGATLAAAPTSQGPDAATGVKRFWVPGPARLHGPGADRGQPTPQSVVLRLGHWLPLRFWGGIQRHGFAFLLVRLQLVCGPQLQRSDLTSCCCPLLI